MTVATPATPPNQTAPKWYKSSVIPRKSKKLFGIRIPATCPKNTKTIPQWKKRLPHFKNLSLERNSLDFADHPNGS